MTHALRGEMALVVQSEPKRLFRLSSLINESLCYSYHKLSLHYCHHPIISTRQRKCVMVRSQIKTEEEEVLPFISNRMNGASQICHWPNTWSDPCSRSVTSAQMKPSTRTDTVTSLNWFGVNRKTGCCRRPVREILLIRGHTLNSSRLLLLRLIYDLILLLVVVLQ